MSTKETIKAAAERLFLTKGYAKTTMRMIATEADVLPNEPHKYTMAMYREIIGYYDVSVTEVQAYSYMLASKGVERIMYQKIRDNDLHISRLEMNRLIVATSLLHLGISKEIIDSAIDGCIENFTPEMMAVLK